MFPSPKTGGMVDPDSFRHTHEKILKAIGTEHIRFPDLRHPFATLSLKNGVDVKTLSSTLGHYSAGFTLSTYTHATPDMMREAADTMGDVIGKAIDVYKRQALGSWRYTVTCAAARIAGHTSAGPATGPSAARWA